MRRLIKIILALVMVWFVYWIFSKMNVVPSLSKIFSPAPVVIDQSPIIIREIQSIGQLITYASLDEVVVDSVVPSKLASTARAINSISPLPVLPASEKRLVLICKGKVHAGVDLEELSDSSIVIGNDTLTMILPPAQILDVIINPGDIETFVERGRWTGDEANQVKAKAKHKVMVNALQQNILTKANEKAKDVMKNYLYTLGYSTVIIKPAD